MRKFGNQGGGILMEPMNERICPILVPESLLLTAHLTVGAGVTPDGAGPLQRFYKAPRNQEPAIKSAERREFRYTHETFNNYRVA